MKYPVDTITHPQDFDIALYVDARWLPLALISKSVGHQELLTTVNGESTEICKSSKEADSVALRKAKRWIDQNR